MLTRERLGFKVAGNRMFSHRVISEMIEIRMNKADMNSYEPSGWDKEPILLRGIVAALKVNINITDVRFDGHDIDDIGAQMIADMLTVNRSNSFTQFRE